MRILGHSLLWLGFLVAAFFSLRHLERPDDKWATIPWGPYGGGLMVGVVGIVCLRRVAAEEHRDHERTDAEYALLQDRLVTIIHAVESLRRDDPPPAEVVRRIDLECAEAFNDFADARNALIKRFDVHIFAEVMTAFASAERYVNRAWSAAADGYVDEVRQSLEIAATQLEQAQQRLQQADQEIE